MDLSGERGAAEDVAPLVGQETETRPRTGTGTTCALGLQRQRGLEEEAINF